MHAAPPPVSFRSLARCRFALSRLAAAMVFCALPASAQQSLELRGSIADTGTAEEAATVSDREPSPPADPWAERRRPLTTARERRRARDTLVPPEATAPAPTTEPEDESRAERALPVNLRAAPVETEQRLREADSFTPAGIRLGLFQLFPSLEQGIAWTSNAESSQDKRAAFVSETTLRLSGNSDWSRHGAEFRAFATLRKSVSGQRIEDPSAGFDGRLRLDLADGFEATARLGYVLRRETADSAVVIAGVTAQPMMHQLAGELGLRRQVGKFRFDAIAGLERQVFEDAELVDGGTLDQGDRNVTLATGRLRVGYEISPALTPFVEGEFGRRRHDRAIDAAGYARSADRLGLRAGLEFDLGEKFRGEVAAGWIHEKPEDERLAAISGMSAAAAVTWSPMRGTDVRLELNTTIEGTTDPGNSGSLLRSARLGVERRIRSDLTGTIEAGLGHRDYDRSGEEWLADIRVGFTWWMNRNLGLTGRASYETVRSDLPGRTTDTAGVFLGLTLRR